MCASPWSHGQRNPVWLPLFPAVTGESWHTHTHTHTLGKQSFRNVITRLAWGRVSTKQTFIHGVVGKRVCVCVCVCVFACVYMARSPRSPLSGAWETVRHSFSFLQIPSVAFNFSHFSQFKHTHSSPRWIAFRSSRCPRHLVWCLLSPCVSLCAVG